MTNAEMIIRDLQELMEINNEIRKSGTQDEYEEGVACIGEYGESLVDYIECPRYGNDCLAQKKSLKYGTREWNEACNPCKALWLMEEYV